MTIRIAFITNQSILSAETPRFSSPQGAHNALDQAPEAELPISRAPEADEPRTPRWRRRPAQWRPARIPANCARI